MTDNAELKQTDGAQTKNGLSRTSVIVLVGAAILAGSAVAYRALADGDAYVKLSGLYRLTKAPYDTLDKHIAALVAANPERCLWGSDWPHIMLNGAQMPQGADLWQAFLRAVPDPATRHQILVENPARLYRFDT